jgi:uncharacterized membrane protein
VLSNGGIGAAVALAQAALPQLDLFPAFVGTIAAVTADTWATEIGLLSRLPPRMITTGETVSAGTSGGVTVLGSSAAAAAGCFIGFEAALLVAVEGYLAYQVPDLSGAPLLLLAPGMGLASTALDSWLGATAQGIYRCPRCDVETERRTHRCGSATELVRGHRRLTNDGVNLAASAAGSVGAWLLYALVWGR